ncbi:contactin, partial [Plakobranchus ocellatus]
PLDRSEYGTGAVDSVGYRVFWRIKDTNAINGQWSERTVQGAGTNHISDFVGEDKYFLPYETKVQAFNDKGFGPNSTVAEVYSAEALPVGVPQNVNTNTYNSTAIEVFWDPVPQTREDAGGIILGYQINYWNQEDDPSTASFIKYYGQVDYGLVIGLDVDVNMIIDVQVYNSA